MRTNCVSKMLAGVLLLFCGQAGTFAADIAVKGDLQQTINQAQPNDRILLQDATYSGNFIIDKPLTLLGAQKSVLDGRGQDNTLTITSPRVTVKNVHVQNWGDDLTAMNAGIFVQQGASDIVIEENTLFGDGFGVYVDKTNNVLVKNNQVQGNTALRSADRGNGIHLSNVRDSRVEGNTVWHTRDGLYIISSQHNILINNRMRELRYGIHYMYSHSNTVVDNYATHVRAGYALMSSRLLKVDNNRAEHCENYGLLLNFVTQSTLSGNHMSNIKADPENNITGDDGKALFVYNSAYNEFTDNRFDNSDLGIHLTAGSEGNQIYRNQFVHNQTQVKYVATRRQEWSKDEQGNYWSNYLGWDLNQDGVGDTPFEPNDGIDKLLWKYPEARVLMDSPAVLMLRWVQRSFPVFKTAGVTDSYPIFQSRGKYD